MPKWLYLRYVELGGLIFCGAALAVLVLMLPSLLERKDQSLPVEDLADFTETAKIDLDEDVPVVEVSTPLSRRAELADLRQARRRGIIVRRRVLYVLLALFVVIMITSALGKTPWWTVLVSIALIIGAVMHSTVVSRIVNATVERRVAELTAPQAEPTLALSNLRNDRRLDDAANNTGDVFTHVPVVEAKPTPKPTLPRTVRTIDLTVPDPGQATSATENSIPVQPLRAVGQ